MNERKFCDIGTKNLNSIESNETYNDDIESDLNAKKKEDSIYFSKLNGSLSGVYVLTLDSKKHINSLCDEFMVQLIEAVNELKTLTDIKCLIIRSALKKYFCVGADLKEYKEMSKNEAQIYIERLRGVSKDIKEFSVPVIAAIDGYALGGGLEYALACDLRIASTTAKMGFPETKLGIIPCVGGTQLLARTLAIHRAKELIFTAGIIIGKGAFENGLVNYCVEQNKGLNAAFLKSLDLAKEIVQCNLLALKISKLAINKGGDVNFETGLVIELLCENVINKTKIKES